MRIVYHHAHLLLCALYSAPPKHTAKLTPRPPSKTLFRPDFTVSTRSYVSTTHPLPTHSSFPIDHSWPVHGVSFPFAADTRGRAQFRRVTLRFLYSCFYSYLHLHFYLLFPLYCYPLLDMTLDDLHIFTWI